MKGAAHDTRCVPVREKLRTWKQASDHFFGPLDAVALDDGPFDARLVAYEAGPLRMVTIQAPAHRVQRDLPAQRMRHDAFKLVLQVQGASEIRQRDAEARLQPGDWCLYDPRVPYDITLREPAQLLAILVPRELLGHLSPGSLHGCTAQAPEVLALQRVLGSFLASLSLQLQSLPDNVGVALSETTLGLLVQAIQAQRGDAPTRLPLPDVLRTRVRHYIEAHLADTDLSVERIAHDMSCSKRYLHVVFEGEPYTLERCIWRARLERCRQSLAVAGRQVSISAVAYRWGFSSNAHFSRLFKREFGVTPSEFLKRGLH